MPSLRTAQDMFSYWSCAWASWSDSWSYAARRWCALGQMTRVCRLTLMRALAAQSAGNESLKGINRPSAGEEEASKSHGSDSQRMRSRR